MSSWCTWQESSLHVQQCNEKLPYTIACEFYSHKKEIFPSSYLVSNTLHDFSRPIDCLEDTWQKTMNKQNS